MEIQFIGGSTDPITLTLSNDSTVEQAKRAFQEHFSLDRPITLLHEGRILTDHLPLSSLSFTSRPYLFVGIFPEEKPDLDTIFSGLSAQTKTDYRQRLTEDPSNFKDIAATICNGDESLIAQLSREKHRFAAFLNVPINGLYSVEPTEEELRNSEIPAEISEDISFVDWPLNLIESDCSGHLIDDPEESFVDLTDTAEAPENDDESVIERFVKMGYDPDVVTRRWFASGRNEKKVMEDLQTTYGGRT
jgi:hypothetical protein